MHGLRRTTCVLAYLVGPFDGTLLRHERGVGLEGRVRLRSSQDLLVGATITPVGAKPLQLNED